MRALILSIFLVISLCGANWFFIGGSTPACTFPSISPLVRFRMDQFTGTGSTLSLNALGSIGTAATVPGGVNAPTIVTNALNGKNVLRFDASSNEYMTFGTAQTVNSTTAHDVILVMQGNGAASGFGVPFIYCTDSSLSRSEAFVASTTAGYAPFGWGGGDGAGASVGITGFDYFTSPMYFLARYNGAGTFVSSSNWTAQSNTTSQTVTLFASGTINSAFCNNLLGAYAPPTIFPFNGDIAEVIVAPTISSPNVTLLNTYMSCQYGL